MFERFTIEARGAVVRAVEIAQETQSDSVGDLQLLAAICERTDGPAVEALRSVGIDPAALARAATDADAAGLDSEALAAIGIDLDAVSAQADKTFGKGALARAGARMRRGKHRPFAREGKKILELSLRELIRLGQHRIDSGHLLLAILRMAHGDAYRVLVNSLTEAGSSVAALRSALESPAEGKAAS